MTTKQCFLGFHVTKPVVSCQGHCVVVGCTSGRVQAWDCASGENMSTAQATEKVVAEWKIVVCCLDMYSEKYISVTIPSKIETDALCEKNDYLCDMLTLTKPSISRLSILWRVVWTAVSLPWFS